MIKKSYVTPNAYIIVSSSEKLIYPKYQYLIVNDFFNSLEFLEPKCPKCGIVIEWDTNTTFDEDKESHVCNKCGFVFSD